MFLVLSLLSALLVSCTDRQPEAVVAEPQPLPFAFDESLVLCDSLLQHDADSAMMCLTSFRPTEGSGEISHTFNANYQSLLISEALYKTDNPQYYRSDLQDAMRRFDSLYAVYPANDDLVMLAARSHYMNGVGFYEDDSVVDACREYLKTLEIMEDHFGVETSQGTALQGYKAKFMGLTYTRLGEVFSNNGIAIPAIYAYKEAIKHFIKLKNYSLANTFLHLGRAYLLDNNNDSALFYYRKARTWAKKQNNISVYYGAMSESSPIYYDLGYIDSAFMMIRQALLLPVNEDQYLAHCFTYGSMLAKECQYDSAIFYLEKSLKRNCFATRVISAEILTNCHQAKGDTTKMMYYKHIYNENFTLYRNISVIKTELQKTFDLYKQKQIQKENLLIEKQQNHNIVLFIILVLALIFGIIIVFRIKVRKTIIKSNYDIAVKDRVLADMKHKMKANTFMNEPICQHILDIVNNNPFKSKIGFEEYKEYAINKDQLLALKDAVDRHYDNFTQRINKSYPELTSDDINYCCLYLLGLKNADISALMQCSYRAVCDRNNKLKHIFGTNLSIISFLHDIIGGKASD